MQEPKEEHMDATCRVLRYLKGTPSYVILLRSDCDLHKYLPIVMQTELPIHLSDDLSPDIL